ncbi:MAG: tetratricopeptide repeat protein [Bacteroidota bacterium]
MRTVALYINFLVLATAAFGQNIDSLYADAEKQLFSRPDSAFILARSIQQLSEDNNFKPGIAKSYHLIGEVFYHQGFYKEALTNLLEADKILTEEQATDELAENLNQLGLVYYNMRQPDLALQKHEQALKIYEQTKNLKGTAYTYGCLGRLNEKKSQYPEALEYQTKALEYYEKVGDKRGRATILENIGSIHEDLEDHKKARGYFTEALALNEATGDSLSMIVNINNLADGYRKTGHNEEAIVLTGKALQLALRLKDQYQIVSAYKDLGKVFNQDHQFQEAYENLEKGRVLYEEIYGEETRRQVALLQTLFEVERKNGEIQILESSQRLNTVVKIALISGLVLLGLLGTTIISRQRLKIRQGKEMIDIKESGQKLMQAELENAHLHEKQLQDELENRTKSLTAHTLHIISKNKILDDLRTKLQEMTKEEMREQRKQIHSLIKLIDNNFVQDKDWDDFRSIFEQVHRDFFEQLQKRSGDLTSADLRLASLIRLNLPSRDIATILGISQDSLRISRYRLRKKLGLNQGESLSGFILSL